MSLHLVIGNKNYSSWSFRPWLAMKVAGIAFDETVISLDAHDFKPRLTALGGSGRVPVLIDGDTRIWESLAILEYLAERFSRRRIMATGCWRTSSCSHCVLRNACGIHGVAAPTADECDAAG